MEADQSLVARSQESPGRPEVDEARKGPPLEPWGECGPWKFGMGTGGCISTVLSHQGCGNSDGSPRK